jgi:adenosylcobinamide-phosphate synthase
VVLEFFQPHASCLAWGVLLDFALGDPVYSLHPVRLIGKTLTFLETALWKIGANGFGGGITLFFLLAALWAALPVVCLSALARLSPVAAFWTEVFLIYSLLALHDLVRHGWNVERAAKNNDTEAARAAISRLVGRDTSRMDIAACRRAVIESIAENLTDGWLSPLFWYAIGGLPLILLFKIVSTMDSMVGYKTSRYLRFGWCGARLDDLMNWIPARITWLLLSGTSLFIPGCSARWSLIIGWRQHAIIPGPNAGWSEAATAGAIRRKLIGPIWARGEVVTNIWVGHPDDSPAGTHGDVMRAMTLVSVAGLVAAAAAIALIMLIAVRR